MIKSFFSWLFHRGMAERRLDEIKEKQQYRKIL